MSALGLSVGNTQNIFNNSETTKNNKVARDVSIMNTTGYISPEYSNNPYIGGNFDFKAKIDELLKDPTKNVDEINQLKEARAMKIKNSSDPTINSLSYDGYTPSSIGETGTQRLGKYQADTQKAIADAELGTKKI